MRVGDGVSFLRERFDFDSLNKMLTRDSKTSILLNEMLLLTKTTDLKSRIYLNDYSENNFALSHVLDKQIESNDHAQSHFTCTCNLSSTPG